MYTSFTAATTTAPPGMTQPEVIIVGAGPSGMAISACLNRLSISNTVLEREDCAASLWKKKSYDRLHLHLPKEHCELPHMPFPSTYPKYVPKKQFLQYLDDYVSHFNISPIFRRNMELANYDDETKKWRVVAKNVSSGEVEEYSGRFLVVATGETSDKFIPEVEGLETFGGEILHSTGYKNGERFRGKSALVVGSGNSGMEIALDLSNHGAATSIVVRSPAHIVTREKMDLGFVLMKYIPVGTVESMLVLLSKLFYGETGKYGIERPKEGPFTMKVKYEKYPIVDVGTYKKIKIQEIQVLPALASIKENEVVFANGKSHPFDVIVFATGFKRSTHKWLKSDSYLLNEDGIPKPEYPNHWKGQNCLYCIGLARRGFYGAASDAHNIADDIKSMG